MSLHKEPNKIKKHDMTYKRKQENEFIYVNLTNFNLAGDSCILNGFVHASYFYIYT